MFMSCSYSMFILVTCIISEYFGFIIHQCYTGLSSAILSKNSSSTQTTPGRREMAGVCASKSPWFTGVVFRRRCVKCQAMRRYINEGALKPKSIPLQIPNCSVAEFGGWEFSAQKETNILSPNAKADDVLKSLFMDPRRWTFLPVQDTSHDDDTRYWKLKLFSTFRKRDISSEHNISSGWQFIKEVISSGGGSDERFSSLHGFHRRR